jgi:hypothetical protein
VKVGFHFDADHESLGRLYGNAIEAEVFIALASLRDLGLSTTMYVGDLRLNSLAMEWQQIGAGREGTFDENKYVDGFAGWLTPALAGWARFPLESMLRCMRRNIYVLYLDSISSQIADRLNRGLECLPYYLGALEVEERSPAHRVLYPGSLLPLCRISGTTVSIFCEGFEGEDLDRVLVERLRRAGFTAIRYEVFSGIIFTD